MAKLVGVFNTAHTPVLLHAAGALGRRARHPPAPRRRLPDNLDESQGQVRAHPQRLRDPQGQAGRGQARRHRRSSATTRWSASTSTTSPPSPSTSARSSRAPSARPRPWPTMPSTPWRRARRRRRRGRGRRRRLDPVTSGPARARIKGHPGLATAILTGLMKRGFDPAFCMDMPKPEDGIGHAFMRPAESLTDLHTPIVPILLNCYYAPQPTGMRCYEFGTRRPRGHRGVPRRPARRRRRLRRPLAHARRQGAYLDEDFDREMLRVHEEGRHQGHGASTSTPTRSRRATSQPVDSQRRARPRPACPARRTPGRHARDLQLDHRRGRRGRQARHVVDYVPVYASPIGCGFAYWPEV